MFLWVLDLNLQAETWWLPDPSFSLQSGLKLLVFPDLALTTVRLGLSSQVTHRVGDRATWNWQCWSLCIFVVYFLDPKVGTQINLLLNSSCYSLPKNNTRVSFHRPALIGDGCLDHHEENNSVALSRLREWLLSDACNGQRIEGFKCMCITGSSQLLFPELCHP